MRSSDERRAATLARLYGFETKAMFRGQRMSPAERRAEASGTAVRAGRPPPKRGELDAMPEDERRKYLNQRLARNAMGSSEIDLAATDAENARALFERVEGDIEGAKWTPAKRKHYLARARALRADFLRNRGKEEPFAWGRYGG